MGTKAPTTAERSRKAVSKRIGEKMVSRTCDDEIIVFSELN
jgi:hypothetical protein